MSCQVGGGYASHSLLLGRRTAQIHQVLYSRPTGLVFVPESFSMLYQRSVYQSMRNLARRNIQSLERIVHRLPETLQHQANELLNREHDILNRFLLEKAVYELGYELNHQPEWIAIPIQGIKHVLDWDGNLSQQGGQS